VVMTLLKPLILNLRADIRNILIWLCQGEPGSALAGKTSTDEAAKQAQLAGQAAVVHPNGTIYFMDLFDPNLGKIALDCVLGHGSSVMKGVTDLFWTRLGQLKEFLVEQLRVAIGLPKFPVGDEPSWEGDEIQNMAGVVEDDRARAFAEWIVGRVLERVERIPASTDLSSKDVIGKEQGEREGHSVISTDAKEYGSSIGSTKMALPHSPSQARGQIASNRCAAMTLSSPPPHTLESCFFC
jgi:hypothetical protein